MALLDRYRITWTGFTGSPGVSTFYAPDATDSRPAIRTFFDSIADQIPNGVTVSFPTTGDIVADDSGVIQGTWTGGAIASVSGTSLQPWTNATGLVVNWRTNTVRRGRRLRGRTFLVPVAGAAASGGGIPPFSVVNDVRAAALALAAASPGILVWGPPIEQGGVVVAAGVSAAVSTADVPQKWVVLRSRRD